MPEVPSTRPSACLLLGPVAGRPSVSACDEMNRPRRRRRTSHEPTLGGGSVTEKEYEGVELLLRDPEIVAWLELDEAETEEEER